MSTTYTLTDNDQGMNAHGRRKAVTNSLAFALLSMAAVGPAHAGGFNIPTDLPASPLCVNGQCATEFSQKLLMFEEFGTQPIPTSELGSYNGMPEPVSATDPNGCDGTPVGTEIDAFLTKPLSPLPTEQADENPSHNPLPNAWKDKVFKCTGSAANFLDARPPGENFGHQRWSDFPPQVFFQSAMAGARTNGGLRDGWQRHGYSSGEFGPNGLYHNNGTANGIAVKIHPNLPTQDAKAVWTFDGTLPPKLLMARYGEPVLFRHWNMLPIDVGANRGFGSHNITTHEHNGHSPAESDGYAHAYSYPGQFYDYHWPMILAGYDTVKNDPKAGAPDGKGGITHLGGDSRETMSTHWFHDHMLDHTAQNVYKGNAAMMNYYSAYDRGNEAIDDGVNLRLPSGTALDWGNRDYDVNLLVADKAWDKNGQLTFNVFNTGGFLADRVTVNWQYKPYLDVRARRYRFRILNGSVSRYYKIALVDSTGKPVPFHMIANDGNIMEHAVPFPNPQSPEALPEQGIAERYDIVVDFGKFKPGDKLYFVNLLEHKDGTGPSQYLKLSDVWSGKYKADGINGDPGVGRFLEFRVQPCMDNGKPVTCTDPSMKPEDYEEGKKPMIPLNRPSTQELQTAVQRTFEFGRSDGTDLKPWTIKTDGGQGFNMDPHRLSAAPDMGGLEIWHIKNGGNGWSHPVHVHFEEGQIIYRGGKAPPIWEKYARKDVYRIGGMVDSTSSVDMMIRFREFAGTYMEHCHNTQHEDNAMLLRWDIQHPGQTIVMPTPMPEWDGVVYDPTTTLPTYKIGDVNAASNFQLP